MSLAEEVLTKRVQELEKQIVGMTETAVQRENLLLSTEKELAQARKER
jgi:hypothetical protein